MKLQRTRLFTLGAAVLLALQPTVKAATVTAPAEGDIFLGVRASGGQGSGASYLVNVGSEAAFRDASQGSTINVGSAGADLSAIFGSSWHTRDDLYWAFFGAPNVPNPPVYGTRAQPVVGTPATPWEALTQNARTATKTEISNVITAYKVLQATANNPKAATQANSSVASSYNYQITGRTTNFGTLSKWTDIEGNFGSGAAGTALDFFRLSGTTAQGNVVKRLGTFTIDSSGAITFTASPLLNEISVAQINYSVQENAGQVTVTFVRSGDLSQAITANFALANGTAFAGTDYTAPGSLQVSFAANASQATAVIPVTDRPGPFGNRSFTASLVSATGGFAVRAPVSSTITVTDVDPASTLSFAQAALEVTTRNAQNNPNTAVLTVTRGGESTGSISVQVSATGGTLANGTHYTFTNSQTLTFLSGETTKPVSIPLTANAVAGTIELTLTNPQGSTALGSITAATVTVTPTLYPGTLAFAAASYPVASSASSVEVTLSRSNGSDGAVSVSVNATSATLTNGTHYTYTNPTTVTFASGATTATTTVNLSTVVGGDIVLTLSSPTGQATLGTQTTTTIAISAPVGTPGTLAFGSAFFSVREEVPTLSLPIVRTDGSSGLVSVSVTAQNVTATSPGDYVLDTAAVSFADGVTAGQAVVTIKLDTVKNEPNETFTVKLANPSGGASLGTLIEATVQILDTDTTKPVVTITTPKANEKVGQAGGNSVSVAVTGTATDNKAVEKIELQVNGGAYQPISFSLDKGKAAFNVSIGELDGVASGVNTINVRSTDFRGNVSAIVSRSFIYKDPFAALAGTYNGLSLPGNGTVASHSNSGLFNVVLQKTGAFSGKVTVDGVVIPFSGVVGAGGAARFGTLGTDKVRVEKPNKPGFEIAFNLDLTPNAQRNKITGTLKEFNRTTLVGTSNVEADRAGFDGKLTAVPSGYLEKKGAYTVIFPRQAIQLAGITSADFPQGVGAGTATLKANGTVNLTATLADGTKVTASGLLWKDLVWPFYAELYAKRGSIGGYITFNKVPDSDFNGDNLFWFRPYQNVQHYPYGWPEGLNTRVLGALYDPTVLLTSSPVNAEAGNAELEFTDGLLSAPVVKAVNQDSKAKITNAPVSDKSFTLAVTQASGLFKGTFTHSDGTKPAFAGVIYQKGSEAGGQGSFLSTAPKVRDGAGEAGAVILSAK